MLVKFPLSMCKQATALIFAKIKAERSQKNAAVVINQLPQRFFYSAAASGKGMNESGFAQERTLKNEKTDCNIFVFNNDYAGGSTCRRRLS